LKGKVNNLVQTNAVERSEAFFEEEAHLSVDRLKKLKCVNRNEYIEDKNSVRPKDNFNLLVEWAKSFEPQEDLNCFVHNRISIDGDFIKFAEENEVTIDCLYDDSIISWNTKNNFEKFFAQGIFKISKDNFHFYQASLFHKGNSFEDEISFFCLVDNENYEEYIKFRNKFEDWSKKRDRSSLKIKVVDGEDQPYEKDLSWDDVFLPQDVKLEIKNQVEFFLSSKDFYDANKIPWKKGLILHGPPGLGKTSLIRTIVSNYDFKPVTMAPGSDENALKEAFSYAEKQSPSLLFFEDLDNMLGDTIGYSTFLNLLDGITAKNGLFVIATANDIKKLKPSVTQRPSRFDRVLEISYPTEDLCLSYLKKWFKNSISNKKLESIVKKCVAQKFTYAYLKEFYISSMFEALSNNRKVAVSKDLDTALSKILKEKNSTGKTNMTVDKYFKNDEVEEVEE